MKFKKYLAITGIVLLVGIYVCAFVFAMIDSPWATKALQAALYSTVVIPALIWLMIMAYRFSEKRKEANDLIMDAALKKQAEEAKKDEK